MYTITDLGYILEMQKALMNSAVEETVADFDSERLALFYGFMNLEFEKIYAMNLKFTSRKEMYEKIEKEKLQEIIDKSTDFSDKFFGLENT